MGKEQQPCEGCPNDIQAACEKTIDGIGKPFCNQTTPDRLRQEALAGVVPTLDLQTQG